MPRQNMLSVCATFFPATFAAFPLSKLGGLVFLFFAILTFSLMLKGFNIGQEIRKEINRLSGT